MVDIVICLAQGYEDMEKLRVVHGNIEPHEVSTGLGCECGTEPRGQKAYDYQRRSQQERIGAQNGDTRIGNRVLEVVFGWIG